MQVFWGPSCHFWAAPCPNCFSNNATLQAWTWRIKKNRLRLYCGFNFNIASYPYSLCNSVQKTSSKDRVQITIVKLEHGKVVADLVWQAGHSMFLHVMDTGYLLCCVVGSDLSQSRKKDRHSQSMSKFVSILGALLGLLGAGISRHQQC